MNDCTHPSLEIVVQAFVSMTVTAGVASEVNTDLGNSYDFFVSSSCPACGLGLSGAGAGTVRGADPVDPDGSWVPDNTPEVDRLREATTAALGAVVKVRA